MVSSADIDIDIDIDIFYSIEFTMNLFYNIYKSYLGDPRSVKNDCRFRATNDLAYRY